MIQFDEHIFEMVWNHHLVHQLIGSLSHCLQGFIHIRWLFGISAINSIAESVKKDDNISTLHLATIQGALGFDNKLGQLNEVNEARQRCASYKVQVDGTLAKPIMDSWRMGVSPRLLSFTIGPFSMVHDYGRKGSNGARKGYKTSFDIWYLIWPMLYPFFSKRKSWFSGNKNSLNYERKFILQVSPQFDPFWTTSTIVGGRVSFFCWLLYYCWWCRNPANQLRLVVYPIISSWFFLHPSWCMISSINSMTPNSPPNSLTLKRMVCENHNSLT